MQPNIGTMAEEYPKVRFKDYKCKKTDGQTDTATVAYIDVTSEMTEIWGSIIKDAILIVDKYHESIGTFDKWKESVKKNQYDITKEHIQVDRTTLYATLTNGNTVEFFTSEWGHVEKLKHTPEILN